MLWRIKVTASGVQLKPALALGSWVAFKRMGTESMVMGDLVLTEDEVNPVMMMRQQSWRADFVQRSTRPTQRRGSDDAVNGRFHVT